MATAKLRAVLAAFLTAAIFGVLLTIAGLAKPDRDPPAQGPPEWPMLGGTPQRNMVNPFVKNLPVEWEVEKGKEKNIKWSVQLGSKAYGGPVIAQGKIFVGTNNQNPREKTLINKSDREFGRPIDLGVIMCFRETDGKFLWQAVHKKLPGGQVVDWPLEGIASSPAIENGRLYYVSNRCELICADVADGKKIWALDMIGTLGVFPHNLANGSPLIVDDTVFLITSNGVNEEHTIIPAPKAPSFLAVNKNTGKVLWQDNSPTIKYATTPRGKLNDKDFFYSLANRGEVVMHSQWSNPAHAVVQGESQVVFPGGDGWLYSFTPAGKLLWKFDCNPKDARFAIRTGGRSEFIAAPVIYKNRVYIGLGQDPENRTGVGHLWCIDMTKRGDVSPELRVNQKIVANPNSAAVWHYGGAINDPALQQKFRRNYVFGRTMSTCAIHDGLVYAAELNGLLHCLDAETGKAYWEHDTRADIWASPYWADGKIYLGTDDGVMYVFRHGREKKLLAEFEMDGRIRAIPAAVNGVLYVMTENMLHAIAQQK